MLLNTIPNRKSLSRVLASLFCFAAATPRLTPLTPKQHSGIGIKRKAFAAGRRENVDRTSALWLTDTKPPKFQFPLTRTLSQTFHHEIRCFHPQILAKSQCSNHRTDA